MTSTDTASGCDPSAPPAAAATGSTGRIRLTLILGVLTALAPFTVDMYLPSLPTIARDLSTSDFAVQLTLTGTLLGLAVGQLMIGPLSDVYGRRRPLVAGTTVHVLASLGCCLAPTVAVLGALRTVQGLGAAATSVIAMAVVRDLFEGRAAAVMLSRLMLVMGVAPVLAPSLGGLILMSASWRGVFLVLAVLGVVMMVLGGIALPETLPTAVRVRRGMKSLVRVYLALFHDARFLLLVLVCGLGRAMLWSYIAGSPFVMQQQFHLSPEMYGFAFTAGAVVLIGASQLNVVLVDRWAPIRVCLAALAFGVVIGAVAIALSATSTGGFAGFAAPVVLLLGATGVIMPNAPALALSLHGETAGTASSMVGFAQFGVAALMAPIVAALGNDALAVAVAMTGSTLLAGLALTAAHPKDIPIH